MPQVALLAESAPALFHGTVVTLELTASMLLLGLLVGVPLGLGQVYGARAAKRGIAVVVVLFRGIPTLVLLFLVYFGTAYANLDISAFAAAVLAIGLRSGIYQSQIVRGAIASIPQGQMLAARAIGMSRYGAIRSIVLPQALRLSVVPWSNEYAVVLKESSLAYAIGVTELMREGRYIVARTFGNALLVYATCAAVYFVFVHIGNRLLAALERRNRIPGLTMAEGVRWRRGERDDR